MLVGRCVSGPPLSTCVFVSVGGVGRRAVCCFLSEHMMKHTGPGSDTSLDGALMPLQVRARVCVCVRGCLARLPSRHTARGFFVVATKQPARPASLDIMLPCCVHSLCFSKTTRAAVNFQHLLSEHRGTQRGCFTLPSSAASSSQVETTLFVKSAKVPYKCSK